MKMQASNKAFNPWRVEKNPLFRGTTGRIFEREVLGTCNIRATGRLEWRQAMNEVIRNQPGSPFEPTGEAARFHQAVGNEMEVLGLDKSRLGIYTAIGSALDRHHQVDGFFMFDGLVVTVDTTINPTKTECRANVLVNGEDQLCDYIFAAKSVAQWFVFLNKNRREGGS